MVAALYAVSIPWYREAGANTGTLLGLPGWAAVALLCYAGAALANAFAWLLTDVPDAEPETDPRAAETDIRAAETDPRAAEDGIDTTAEEGS